ncbi:hypothetical protein SLEP1_g41439 [Rubroshorea leprosula]|uniref:Uncharacterized protein n=1 Tax=Rubroshorea leprosula TaxID=152421 RepID=A0AAV5L7G4_9ROSI|nr:hypothetical protein SLEP1_g41439 [Rubroshorea leprosula]
MLVKYRTGTEISNQGTPIHRSSRTRIIIIFSFCCSFVGLNTG